MDWLPAVILLFGGLLVLLLSGLPVAFSFTLINIVGAFILWGGELGLRQLIVNMFSSVSMFALIAVPLFTLMGEVMLHSGVASRMMDVLDKWMGRMPGRLALLSVAGGTIIGTLSGASMSSVAMLGSALVPEMERRGYKKPMSLGPILGSGGLAMMIPPSALGVLVGALAGISIGRLLIAIIVPGLLMAVFYASYIVIRCQFQPSIAPAYKVTSVRLREKIISFLIYVLPLGSIVFLVVGCIILGIATPSESAAMGALGTFILALAYRRLDWDMLKKALPGTLTVTSMMFMILTGSMAFSQILAYSGASQGLVSLATSLPLSPIMLLVAMQIIVLVMGMFMEPLSIMMVSLPIYMPLVTSLGFDTVWFGTMMLLNLEMGGTTPPFGILLFVMKGVAPEDTTMGDVYRAVFPFLGCDVLVMALIMAFPALVLWLPSVMR